MAFNIEDIKFDSNGLVPAIAQEYSTKEVLMLAYMNSESLKKTVETGKVHYYSRSRKQLWLKGETSGNYQIVKSISYDCDGDAVLVQVEQMGNACHTGHHSCFYTDISGNEIDKAISKPVYFDARILKDEYETIVDRKENPREGSYTTYLLEKGIDKTLKKIGEESSEVIIAAKNNVKEEIIYEMADLMYHLAVTMVQTGVSWEDIFSEMRKRR